MAPIAGPIVSSDNTGSREAIASLTARLTVSLDGFIFIHSNILLKQP